MDASSCRCTSSKPVQQNNHDKTDNIIIINSSDKRDLRATKANRCADKIIDLKQGILRLWSLDNVTVDQLELYVYDEILSRKESLYSKPDDTPLIMFWGDKDLIINFKVKSKSEPISKSSEKPPLKATKSTCEHVTSNSTEESLSAAANHSEKIPNGLCGLENIGNTCYMNSALQCLSNIPPLRHFFMQNSIVNLINSKNPTGSGGRVTLTFGSLIQEMWSGKLENCIPTALKQRIDSYTSQFIGHSQHDAQEFMNVFLDVLHEDLSSTQTERSPISELFQGQMETIFRCENHCPPVIVPSKFNFLSLPIPMETRKTDLFKCMESFLEKDFIGDHGKWNCDSCHQKTNAWKLTHIKKLPPVLIFQLKRFDELIPSKKQHSNSHKNETLVTYPVNNMPSSILVPGFKSIFLYDLVAISIHHGRSLNSGHYTTIAKNCKNKLWYTFDDSLVTLASENDLQTKDAYILCYVRKDMNQVFVKKS